VKGSERERKGQREKGWVVINEFKWERSIWKNRGKAVFAGAQPLFRCLRSVMSMTKETPSSGFPTRKASGGRTRTGHADAIFAKVYSFFTRGWRVPTPSGSGDELFVHHAIGPASVPVPSQPPEPRRIFPAIVRPCREKAWLAWMIPAMGHHRSRPR